MGILASDALTDGDGARVPANAGVTRRQGLVIGAAAFLPATTVAQRPRDYPLFSDLATSPLTLDIDDKLRAALLAVKIFPAGRHTDDFRRIFAILSVDCIWCRYQYAQNRKLLHAQTIHYALTYSDPKFAPLVNPSLLLAWGTAERHQSEYDDDALGIFLGIETLESVERTPEELRAIEKQADAVGDVTSLLDQQFSTRGLRTLRFPLNFMVNRSLTQLMLIAPGYSALSYIGYIPHPRDAQLYRLGFNALRGYARQPSSEVTAILGQELPEAAWSMADKLFHVATGGRPFYAEQAKTAKLVYVIVDPSDVESRLVWDEWTTAEFYIQIRWLPVPDFEDDQSVASWLYLFRNATRQDSADLQDVLRVESVLTSVMLGYEPRDKGLKPSQEEAALMLRARVFADRLVGADKSLPIFLWKDMDKTVRSFSTYIGLASIASLIEYSAAG